MRTLLTALEILDALTLSVLASAEGRIKSVQKSNGTWTTCHVCDHVTICS